MDYREFTGAVEKEIRKRMKGGVQASLYTTVKNNGKERTGVLLQAPGVHVSPTIYLEDYYQAYLEGKPIDRIAGEIECFYNSMRQEVTWDGDQILNYEGIKDRIVFKLINTAANRDFLTTVPHYAFLDLSIVFYVLLEVTDEGTAAMVIGNDHAEQWRVETDMLWKAAVENGKTLLPAEFFTMNHALKEMLGEAPANERGDGNLLLGETADKDGMYVLSNKIRSYGAACIAYPHVLKMIGQILRKDYYILPSSVHEVVIVPWAPELRWSDLDDMVTEINATQVAEEEVLSGHAYLYKWRSERLLAGRGLPAERRMG